MHSFICINFNPNVLSDVYFAQAVEAHLISFTPE